MSLRSTLPIVLTAALAGAFGYWAGRSQPPAPAAGSSTARNPLHSLPPLALGIPAPETSYPIPEELRLLLGGQPVPDEAMRAKVMQVLEEPDPVRRAAAITLLLETMTPANADAFRSAFLQTTAKSGRRHGLEWGLMLRQYGKVVGADTMTRLKDAPQDAQRAFEGWAIADPVAVQSWLSPAHPDYKLLRMTMLSGIALADPDMAFSLVLAAPGAPLESSWLIQNAVLAKGTDGVTAALQQALDQAPPEAADHPAFHDLFGKLSDAVFRQKWEARESVKMLPWLESLKDQPFVTADMIGHGAMDSILQGNLTQTLDWLDRMEGPGARPAVTDGLLRGVLGNRDALAKADAATMERVLARFSGNPESLQQIAQAMASKNPVSGAGGN